MVEFGDLSPMLAIRTRAPFSSSQYAFEVKWDGYRALAYITEEGVRWQSRQGKELTATFPLLKNSRAAFSHPGAVLDGEIVSMEQGRSSFHHLRRGQGSIVYVAFDLLATGGGTLIVDQPWQERRHRLEEGWEECPHWSLSPVVMDEGEVLWQVVTRQGHEGMIAKTKTSPYLVGRRSSHWLKLSHRKTLDCIIVSLLMKEGRRLSSVGVAVYHEGTLHYLGQVGSGLNVASARRIIETVQVVNEPVVEEISPKQLWVTPELVCTVEYLEITPARRLRHPVFRQLRPDLSVKDCGWPLEG